MIWLVRHGQTAFNAEGRIQGAKDSPLTALGVEQGERLGALMQTLAPADVRIIASPRGRAQHTARLIREHGGFTAEIENDERLVEVSMGEWDGMLREDIRQLAPDFDAGDHRWNWFFDAPGAESHDALSGRLTSWLADARAAGGPMIVVSHGVAGRVLRGLFLGLPRDEALMLDVPQDACFRMCEDRIERFDSAVL